MGRKSERTLCRKEPLAPTMLLLPSTWAPRQPTPGSKGKKEGKETTIPATPTLVEKVQARQVKGHQPGCCLPCLSLPVLRAYHCILGVRSTNCPVLPLTTRNVVLSPSSHKVVARPLRQYGVVHTRDFTYRVPSLTLTVLRTCAILHQQHHHHTESRPPARDLDLPGLTFGTLRYLPFYCQPLARRCTF